MAKGLSHLFSRINGSVAGLTYQGSGDATISLRSRTHNNQVKSNAAFNSRAFFQDAQTIWKRFTPAQREICLQWAEAHDYPMLGPRPRTMNSTRMAWGNLYRLGRRTNMLSASSLIGACLPALNSSNRSCLFVSWTSTIAGRVVLTLNFANVFNGYWYTRALGPYPATVNKRPHGWKSTPSSITTTAGGGQRTVSLTGLKSGKYYFVIAQGICQGTNGFVYLGEYETRILVL